MRKVVFLVQVTFNKRDYHRFGIEIIKNRGYEVHVWDTTPLFIPNYCENYTPPDQINFDKCFLVYKKEHIEELISKLSVDDVVVSIVSIEREKCFIFDLLSKKGVRYGYLLLGQLPNNKKSIVAKLLIALKEPKFVVSKIKNMIEENHINIKPCDFLIVGGENALSDGRYPTGESTEIIKAHALDYDRYLEEERDVSFETKAERYAVFLDEFVPYHPDPIFGNRKSGCSAEKYYPPLRRFFDYLEDKFKMKVIIAAHPRADYEKLSSPFGVRDIVYGETVKLVKNAKMVLAHDSSSVNFAILYQKPLVFLFDPVYKRSFRESIHLMAFVLKRKPIDLSKPFPGVSGLTNGLEVNRSVYNDYQSKFIKESGTPKKQIWDIFTDYLDEL